MPLKKYFKVYKGDDYIGKYDREGMMQITGVPYNSYYRSLKNQEFTFNDYRIVPNFVSEDTKQKKSKEEIEYETIERLLKENGNTILIKKDLKFLPRLKEKFRLDIKHYEKTRVSKKVKLIEGSREDWVITWLDWDKKCNE